MIIDYSYEDLGDHAVLTIRTRKTRPSTIEMWTHDRRVTHVQITETYIDEEQITDPYLIELRLKALRSIAQPE